LQSFTREQPDQKSYIDQIFYGHKEPFMIQDEHRFIIDEPANTIPLFDYGRVEDGKTA
jgi:hypothetical protein